MNEDGEVSELQYARIDVHHSAEQCAAVDYQVETLRRQLEKAEHERRQIHQQFYEKCMVLARLRDT